MDAEGNNVTTAGGGEYRRGLEAARVVLANALVAIDAAMAAGSAPAAGKSASEGAAGASIDPERLKGFENCLERAIKAAGSSGITLAKLGLKTPFVKAGIRNELLSGLVAAGRVAKREEKSARGRGRVVYAAILAKISRSCRRQARAR